MKIFSLLLLSLFSNYIFSQSLDKEVVSSAGQSFQGETIQIDWTVGEVAITTIQNSSIQITQGFHQPNLIITKVEDIQKPFGNIKIFPNPVTDWVEVNLDLDQQRKVSIQLFDMEGKHILTKVESGKLISQTIALGHLSSGNYLLHIEIDGHKYLQTFKINKLN